VLGVFPESGEDTLITPSLVLAAQQRELPLAGERQFGVRRPRYGSDETMIYLANGAHLLFDAWLAGGGDRGCRPLPAPGVTGGVVWLGAQGVRYASARLPRRARNAATRWRFWQSKEQNLL
jgi:hypothetical protein